MTNFRALCVGLTEFVARLTKHYYEPAELLTRAALADEPAVPEGREPAAVIGEPSDKRPTKHELFKLLVQTGGAIRCVSIEWIEPFARAVLARWGNAAPQPPAEGEVAELVQQLHHAAEVDGWDGASPEWCQSMLRAAELLQRQALVPVPVSVSDALIKAECALSDIAEGEPMTDEGDPLQWAERRCADTLAIIRPTMRQHKICTSEWPPLPLPEVGQ